MIKAGMWLHKENGPGNPTNSGEIIFLKLVVEIVRRVNLDQDKDRSDVS